MMLPWVLLFCFAIVKVVDGVPFPMNNADLGHPAHQNNRRVALGIIAGIHTNPPLISNRESVPLKRNPTTGLYFDHKGNAWAFNPSDGMIYLWDEIQYVFKEVHDELQQFILQRRQEQEEGQRRQEQVEGQRQGQAGTQNERIRQLPGQPNYQQGSPSNNPQLQVPRPLPSGFREIPQNLPANHRLQPQNQQLNPTLSQTPPFHTEAAASAAHDEPRHPGFPTTKKSPNFPQSHTYDLEATSVVYEKPVVKSPFEGLPQTSRQTITVHANAASKPTAQHVLDESSQVARRLEMVRRLEDAQRVGANLVEDAKGVKDAKGVEDSKGTEGVKRDKTGKGQTKLSRDSKQGPLEFSYRNYNVRVEGPSPFAAYSHISFRYDIKDSIKGFAQSVARLEQPEAQIENPEVKKGQLDAELGQEETHLRHSASSLTRSNAMRH